MAVWTSADPVSRVLSGRITALLFSVIVTVTRMANFPRFGFPHFIMPMAGAKRVGYLVQYRLHSLFVGPAREKVNADTDFPLQVPAFAAAPFGVVVNDLPGFSRKAVLIE